MTQQEPGLAFAAAVSTLPDTGRAVEEACSAVGQQLGGAADLVVAFASHDHAERFDDLARGVAAALPARQSLGCTGESIVAGEREFEGTSALSVWAARLPGVTLEAMHLRFERAAEGGSITGWSDAMPEEWPAESALLMLAEPFSFPADWLLQKLNEDRPSVPVVGGMASGGHAPGQNLLFWNGRRYDEGAIAMWMAGAIRVRTVVSQGCRPIGRHFVITKAQQNVIQELSGKPALAQLQEVFASLSPRDQQLVHQGLHLGRVTNEYQDSFGRGDFLVRNVIGGDPDQGAIAIGDFVRPGQTVQFHVRDAETADEDLRTLLEAAQQEPAGATRGGLLFTCNGRGTRLFPEPHHDAQTVQARLGGLPLAGFFAQGEIGPIGGKNFLHGFTASLALFEPREVR
jgi:small ligand-binding sensory domain FIST